MLKTATTVVIALVLSGVAFAAGMAMMTQQAHTAHYRLVLGVGPAEPMYSQADAAKTHPTSGMIVTGGQMPMSAMTMNTRHVVVHVYSLATGNVVTTATCTITLVNRGTGMRTAVPIVTMYSAEQGQSSWHYGNNVTMPPGAYDITVTANGERAMFHVTNPKM